VGVAQSEQWAQQGWQAWQGGGVGWVGWACTWRQLAMHGMWQPGCEACQRLRDHSRLLSGIVLTHDR
jgi:hypothetical protein